MPYNLSKPCPECPFRTDCREGWLGGLRATEIANSIRNGSEFPCHKTTESCEDAEAFGDRRITPNSQQCAGALIVQEHEHFPNQMTRIMERLGAYDPRKMDMQSPVFKTFGAFIRHHSRRRTSARKEAA